MSKLRDWMSLLPFVAALGLMVWSVTTRATDWVTDASCVDGAEGGLVCTLTTTPVVIDPPDPCIADPTLPQCQPLPLIQAPDTYQACACTEGDKVWIDRNSVYRGIPPAYAGMTFIQTANDDKGISGDHLFLNLPEASTVYLGYDQRTTVPLWLSTWTPTGDTWTTSKSTHNVYAQQFPAGEVVIPGNDGTDAMYVVAVGIQVEPPVTGSISLQWVPPTQSADGSALDDLAGYKVYFSRESGAWNNAVNALTAQATVEGLTAGEWFATVTALDEVGNESGYSNVVNTVIE